MTLTTLTALAMTTVSLVGPTAGHPAARPHDDPGPALHRVLQRDADQLLRLGAPGVLARVDTPRSRVQVRSGAGNVRTARPVPWRAQFRVGSFTKTFVAATVLQLVGEGRLSLDDTVDHWLPSLVRGHGNDGRTITIRQLLQHTSGLPDYVAGLTYLFDEQGFREHRFDTVTARDAVRLAMTMPHEFTPGSRWKYSNTNYALAGLVIRAVTGKSWRHEVRSRIIEPLGLRHTTAPNTSPYIPARHAIGYERFPGPGATPADPKYGKQINATLQNPSWGGAAGAIISTTADANRFLRALVRGEVLGRAELRQMMTTVLTNEDFRQAWPGARYGLGLVWIPNSCGGSWAHGGDIPGFMTRNGVSPDGSRSAVVSLNTDSPKPRAGVPPPKTDLARRLIDDALCR